MSVAGYSACFDASALVKLYVDEPGSPEVRQYWRSPAAATRYTTPFCLYETLTALKRHDTRGTITRDHYLKSAKELVIWFRASTSRINDLDFVAEREVLADVLALAADTGHDLSDAFLLLSLQAGYFSRLVGGSATLFVSADEKLVETARRMKLRAWDCAREPVPG